MQLKLFITLLFIISTTTVRAVDIYSIQRFNVKPGNSPMENKENLQKAIDWAAKSGSALFVEPSEDPYHIDGGLVLKKNVSLTGVNGPTPRGTVHPEKPQPVGSVIMITDQEKPFITVESGTRIKGIQFWYPEQTLSDPEKIIEYPATIQTSKTSRTQGVYLSCLTFYGGYLAMDFNASRMNPYAVIQAVACIDKNENLFNEVFQANAFNEKTP